MSLLDRPPEAQVVFTSTDPAEAAAVAAMLKERGCASDMLRGADPVTGMGGDLFGGGSATFFNVTVPLCQVESACGILEEWTGPALITEKSEEPVEEPPPDRSLWRRSGPWILGVLLSSHLLAVLVIDVLFPGSFAGGDVLAAYLALYAGVGVVVYLAVLASRRR